jgi:hypothetical protein
MWTGTLRKNVVATKNTYSCQWDMLPTKMSMLADYDPANPTLTYSAKEIKTFYENTTGPFVVTLLFDGAATTENVMISAFSYSVVKRSGGSGNFDFANVSIELEEI